jgi:PTH1 family peptidyl-tRNA hydrolase
MKLIIGLGNPGEQYQNTRHNVGFLAIDSLAKRLDLSDWESDKPYQGETTKNQGVFLLKPDTFMNLSGQSVKKVVEDKEIELNDVWVIQDEADLPLGSIRVKKGGTDAGHNGIKSIDSAISNDYWRIRIGIGKDDGRELSDHVLERFTQDEQKQLDDIIDQVTGLLVKFLESGIEPITINN